MSAVIGRRGLLRGLSFIAVGLVASGCGVPSSDGPEVLPSDIAAIGPTTTNQVATDAAVPVGVAWIRGKRLMVVDRLVAATGREERVKAALGALVGGPDAAEQQARLTTLVPPDAVLTAQLSGRRAVVNLALGSGPVNQSLAVGQVALTTLSVRGVHSVVFTVDGTATSVPLPSGKESKGPVTARDYRKNTVN